MQNVMLEYDNGQMQERYVHYDAMKRSYAMHDMNAFTDTRARKIISSYLRIWGRSAPCVQLRR